MSPLSAKAFISFDSREERSVGPVTHYKRKKSKIELAAMESTISFCSQLLLMVTERFLSKPILSKQALLLILHTIKLAVQDISTSMNLQVKMLEIICQLLNTVNTHTNKMQVP